MATRCVLCGKEYARKVTDVHRKTHRCSQKRLDATTAALPEAVWDFYWTHSDLQSLWPKPASDDVPEGRSMTFKQWSQHPKVVRKHPELAEAWAAFDAE